MSPEAQRIAIAEWCGWTLVVTESEILKLKKPIWYFMGKDGFEPPDYLHDLNAMHEAEERLDINQSAKYEKLLFECANQEFTTGESSRIVPEWHATAAQRAEALLRTIGKWEDDK